MSIVELKEHFHSLIDEIDDKEFLEEFYKVFKVRKENKNIDFWDELSENEQKELDDAFLESEDDKNLVDHDEVMKDPKKWLKR